MFHFGTQALIIPFFSCDDLILCFHVCIFPGINLLPSELTADYLTAKRRAPELVDRESDPIKALIRNDWDPWASAERLCNYWRLRREIFQQAGEDEDRWLLPLDLSGKGALRQEEIRLLRSGAICLTTNERGRQVLIYDLKRAQGPTEFVSRARCVQYLQTHWATNVSRQEGYDLILCASSSLGARPNKRNGELLREGNASLSRLRHICIVHDVGDVRKMLVRYCGAFISRLVKRWKGVYPHMVCEDTQSATLSKLKEIGMDPSCIPEEYGGTWKFRDFCDTIEKQIQIDTHRSMPADASQILRNNQVNESMLVAQTMAPQFSSLAAAQPNSTENLQLLAASGGGGGGVGIAPAPEMYTTNLVLQACAELDKTNKKAHRDKDFYLKRNAAYSRRNYLRRKEKDQALQQEHERLLQQKGALQLENERLEGLLKEAKSMVSDLE